MMRQIELYKRYCSREGEEGSLGKGFLNFRNEMEMIMEWVKETQII
jgi:hypothetical protein